MSLFGTMRSLTAAAVLMMMATTTVVSGAFSPAATMPATTRTFFRSSSSRTNALFGLQKRTRTIVHMGWGPDPIWTSATVKSNIPACPSKNFVCVTLDVSPDVVKEYTVAGQYVQIKGAKSETEEDPKKPIYLAIASPPNTNNSTTAEEKKDSSSLEFEFLIKKTDAHEFITSAAPGTTVDISQVLGKGFPTKEHFDGFKYDFPTQNILLFANGSGIAPIRAVIESGALHIASPGTGGRTARLYYGVRTPEDLSYANLFGRWELSGVEVVPVISRPERTSEEEWEGRSGCVQNALEEDGIPIPRNSGALLCGVQGMQESVKDLMVKAGVFEGRILTNY